MDEPRVRFGGVQTPGDDLFELTGGRLCLDFANTLDERPTDHRRERLRDYGDLLDWAVQAGSLSRGEASALREHATRHPREVVAALDRARKLRESLFAIFSAIAHQRPVPSGDLATLNEHVPETFGGRTLERDHGRLVWSWRAARSPHLDRVLWAVVLSAAELLTSPDLDRVRECEGAGCAWLFLDTSKNRTRRWCDMSVCGNRAKARRHYARLKEER